MHQLENPIDYSSDPPLKQDVIQGALKECLCLAIEVTGT